MAGERLRREGKKKVQEKMLKEEKGNRSEGHRRREKIRDSKEIKAQETWRRNVRTFFFSVSPQTTLNISPLLPITCFSIENEVRL